MKVGGCFQYLQVSLGLPPAWPAFPCSPLCWVLVWTSRLCNIPGWPRDETQVGRAGAFSWDGTGTGSLAFGTGSFWVYSPPPGKSRSFETPSRLPVPSQVRADTEAEWVEGGLEGQDLKDFSPNISLNPPNRPLSWVGGRGVGETQKSFPFSSQQISDKITTAQF